MQEVKNKKIKKDIHLDAPFHVTGKTKYIDDLPELEGTLFAKVFDSSCAHGKLISVDTSKAEELEGVFAILTAKDVPGVNQIGGIIKDEPLLAETDVHFMGQPVALVLAESEEIAHEATALIHAEYEQLEVIVDPKEAYAKGSMLSNSRTFSLGSPDSAFAECAHVFEGKADSGGQEHLYLETQGAYAIPRDQGGILVESSTQGPTAVQRVVAAVLGLEMSKIEVNVNRIGGGFGGKEDQASLWAGLAALGCFVTGRPVKLILERHEDLRMTGKRHPYRSDYKIGLDKDLNIVAFEASFFQNGGGAADLSTAVLERTLFHGTNSYFVPNVRMTAHPCKTHIAPNTAFRGFGGPQGMFVMEAAIHHAARELGVSPWGIQKKNLLRDGNEFSYGQIVENSEANRCWDQAHGDFDFLKMVEEVEEYNHSQSLSKKGLAIMPICFGISFTNTPMNNARALVHVYGDGSVGVSTGAVEMGQGVNTKMVQVAALMFGLPYDRIRLETTNTSRVANTSPSAASATADLNGRALQDACRQILERLVPLAAELLGGADEKQISFSNEMVFLDGNPTELSWDDLVAKALLLRLNMSAKGHYSTPVIHFDKEKEKGHPFAYHVYGTSIFEVTVDCIRGTYDIDSVKIVHDFGSSMNKAVDLGQIEGGLVQGIGWMTLEDLQYDKQGRLRSHTLANYKIPDVYSIPEDIQVKFLNTDHDNLAILRSKAVGEPPLMYGIGAYFALTNAILAFNPNANIPYDAPMTTEKILMALYSA